MDRFHACSHPERVPSGQPHSWKEAEGPYKNILEALKKKAKGTKGEL